ncbi:MAG: MarR family transcriptional regulator [Clostridia bacterium]|nr:MarR family transcriptional regulator [Clostridia bacterium]
MDKHYYFPRKVIMLGNAVTNDRNRKMQSYQLTCTQSDAIRYILKNSEKKQVSAADLMEQLGLSQSTVAGVLKRLEEKELILRRTSPEDQRKVLLFPTEKGLELRKILKENARHTEETLIRGMSEEEVMEFDRLLSLALENITKEFEGGNP